MEPWEMMTIIIILPSSTTLKAGYTASIIHNEVVGGRGGILVSLRLSVCPSVRPSWWHPVVWILLLYPMDLLHHLEKGKEEISPLQYHFKSLHIISRHYKKSLLRSQIYHGYEELSTDKNYPIWRRQERRSKYVVQLASWQLRSNSPKMSVQT